MLDGLAAAGGGAERDGACDEDDELARRGPLEEAELGHVRRVRQHRRLLLPAAAPRRRRGGGGVAGRPEHQQRRDLHRGARNRMRCDGVWLAAIRREFGFGACRAGEFDAMRFGGVESWACAVSRVFFSLWEREREFGFF